MSSYCVWTQQLKATLSFRILRPFLFFVCSFCRVVQVAKTKKWNSFWRLFVLTLSIRRQNKQTKWPYPASIVRRVEGHIPGQWQTTPTSFHQRNNVTQRGVKHVCFLWNEGSDWSRAKILNNSKADFPRSIINDCIKLYQWKSMQNIMIIIISLRFHAEMKLGRSVVFFY